LLRLCRLAGGLILALALGPAAMAVAEPATAVLDFPLLAEPAGGYQSGPIPPNGPQPGGLPPGFVPWGGPMPWSWQLLPNGLVYPADLASTKEPRLASQWFYERHAGWTWDTELGARVGLLRYGSDDGERPEGFQLDMEGAAFPRLSLEHGEDVVSTDYRIGFPFTYGWDQYQVKFGYMHICSHLGDEYMLANPDVERINYVRNCLLLGGSYFYTKDLRVYAESSWAFEEDGGARPWEFQFGVEYSPAGPTGFYPKPFFAVNGDIRQEVDYGGNICVETGCQWRGAANHLFRAGVQYFSGKSDQYQFFKQYEEKIGLGLWYDF
jgi:hypothetical protein